MRLLQSELIDVADSVSSLRLTTTGDGPARSRLLLNGLDPIMHLGTTCGTCPFFFRHLSNREVSSSFLHALSHKLEHGLADISDAASQFATVLPNASYTVALLRVAPRLSEPETDYFANDQMSAWDLEPESGTPPYYLGESKALSTDTKLFEFLIPLTSPTLLNPGRVRHYVEHLKNGKNATAVALALLDTKTSMNWPDGADFTPGSTNFRTHWCFANYLLDGHHKVHAAHLTQRPLTLLSFIQRSPVEHDIDELIRSYSDDIGA